MIAPSSAWRRLRRYPAEALLAAYLLQSSWALSATMVALGRMADLRLVFLEVAPGPLEAIAHGARLAAPVVPMLALGVVGFAIRAALTEPAPGAEEEAPGGGIVLSLAAAAVLVKALTWLSLGVGNRLVARAMLGVG